MPFQHEASASFLEAVRMQAGPRMEPFNMGELRHALKRLKNRSCSDESCIAAEMFKHASEDFLKTLFDFFNEMVSAGRVDASWRETLFPMLPKTGDLASVQH